MAGFEEHLTQLETVVQQLERGDLTLEESVKLFEEGMKLSQACKLELEQAEGRIQVLMDGKGGKLQVAELDVAGGDDFGSAEEEEER